MAGKFWQEYDGGIKMTVHFLGGKFSRRYIFWAVMWKLPVRRAKSAWVNLLLHL